MTTLVLPYPPGKNQLWRAIIVPGKKTARVILSREARAYFAAVAAVCREAVATPLAGELEVTLAVYRPRRAGDLDGRLPAVLDALTQGGVWHDDSQVVAIHATRHDDKDNPRVDVVVRPARGLVYENARGNLDSRARWAGEDTPWEEPRETRPPRASAKSLAALAVPNYRKAGAK